jgi:predicted DNA-binding transcriptional regulator YafY
MRGQIRRAMQDHDELVVEFCYRDFKGVETRRVVSPIRFVGGNRFLGLCLSREAPRQFYLERCRDLSLQPASNYVMPVPMLPN